jgi:hypothetical protein
MQPNIQPSLFSECVTTTERPLLVNIVARRTGLPKTTIRWNVRKGHLRGFKDPTRPKIWLFWWSDVEAFIARRDNVLQAN